MRMRAVCKPVGVRVRARECACVDAYVPEGSNPTAPSELQVRGRWLLIRVAGGDSTLTALPPERFKFVGGGDAMRLLSDNTDFVVSCLGAVTYCNGFGAEGVGGCFLRRPPCRARMLASLASWFRGWDLG